MKNFCGFSLLQSINLWSGGIKEAVAACRQMRGEESWDSGLREKGFYKHWKSLNGRNTEACEEVTKFVEHAHSVAIQDSWVFSSRVDFFFDNYTTGKLIELVY